VELISRVTSYIQPILDSPSNVQVIVKVYGDLFKLWRTYEAAGSNLGSSDLTRFFSHFNRKDSLVDFVDFGPRKASIERKLSGKYWPFIRYSVFSVRLVHCLWPPKEY
jgi:hypothetical protein